MMAQATYVLCAVTAFACAFLLLRAFRQTGVRLLLWSGVCFAALTLENVLLFIDRVVIPDMDLALLRNAVALVGLLFLVYGLIWEARSS
jgi:predicted transporter